MHSPLHKPFPYRATAKLRRDLKSKFTEDDCINSILNGNELNITFQQIKWLKNRF